MPRYQMKGGIWKNTEDEILKAAVMKYGINQWARISSLLVRKSARDCKARWFEWLDPSIKKTEWSREEEEKLLHLAKLMPCQWRTIAPIVGRTAAQCLEHYEKLLDAAQEKDDSYDPLDDPRRLRPGEIDPTPEAKPARPDPIDMDEDEKEMLQEARARLANTKGKKAKRKAREKQLEEARRLAALQKRRELKAAGIDVPQRRKNKSGIDYNKEIPFHKRPPPGLYEVPLALERPGKPNLRGMTLQKLEGERRDEEEEKLRKKDIEKKKRKEVLNLPEAVLQQGKLESERILAHSKLSLPSPQMSDQELEEIAKFTKSSALSEDADAEMGPTQTLLADYRGATPTPLRSGAGATPMVGATPARTPARPDTVLLEAQNLISWTQAPTPLLGEVVSAPNPSDFSGVLPARHEHQTPNPLAAQMTPLRGGRVPTDARAGAEKTPMRTPLRDQFNINQEDALSAAAEEESFRKKQTIQQLRARLSALPAPKNKYQIALPSEEEEEDSSDKSRASAMDVSVEDQADIDQREQKKAEEEAQARFKERSTVLQRGNLPRPVRINPELVERLNHLPLVPYALEGNGEVGPTPADARKQAEALIHQEIYSILAHDAIHYPVSKKAAADDLEDDSSAKQSNGKVVAGHFDRFRDSEIAAANSLIQEEFQSLRSPVDFEKFCSVWEKVHAPDYLLLAPSTRSFQKRTDLDLTERLSLLNQRFDLLRQQMGKEAEKSQKLEKKVALYNRGYEMRAAKLQQEVETLYEEVAMAQTERQCFQTLQRGEEKAIQRRLGLLQKELEEQKQRENELQVRYSNLRMRLSDLGA